MAHYKLFACLLVPFLLMANWRVSHARRVSFKLPESVDQNAIIRALHDQQSFIKLNPVIIDVKQVPTEPSSFEAEWFQTPKTGDPIQTYILKSIITVLPGVGRWGQKHIQFGTWLRNIESGIKTYADAPFGVSVGSQWMVQPDTTHGSKGWMLVVDRSVKCVWWLIPFVTYTYDEVHASVGRDLVKLAGSKEA